MLLDGVSAWLYDSWRGCQTSAGFRPVSGRVDLRTLGVAPVV